VQPHEAAVAALPERLERHGLLRDADGERLLAVRGVDLGQDIEDPDQQDTQGVPAAPDPVALPG